MTRAELLCLKIRNLITDKELNIAAANREIAQFGAWSSDHQGFAVEIDAQIKPLMEELERLTNPGDLQ